MHNIQLTLLRERKWVAEVTTWRQKSREKVPMVNLPEMVVIMRTDNTWEHVERITITESNTREHRNIDFLSQTLVSHTCNIKYNPSKFITPAFLDQILLHNLLLAYAKPIRLLMQQDLLITFCSFSHTEIHTHTHTHTRTYWAVFPSRTGPCTGSLFKRGCFEFQRGAHERAAEYKGVPKDTLRRSMWGQFSPDGKAGSKAWPP